MDREEEVRQRPDERPPHFWLIGGPNGAGKSTLARGVLFGSGLPFTTSVLNPDAITRNIGLPMPWWVRPLLSTPYLGPQLSNWAGVVAVEAVVRACLDEGTDVAAETVLSTSKFLKHVRHARKCGHLTGLIFVALPDPEQHIARVRARVQNGGHPVPEWKIPDRWERAHQQLALFAPEVDRLLVFANQTVGTPELVAEKGEAGEINVFSDSLPRVTRALAP